MLCTDTLTAISSRIMETIRDFNNYSFMHSGTYNHKRVTPIDSQKLEQYMLTLLKQQNLYLALFCGIAAAAAGAIGWGLVTSILGQQVGFVAVGIGCLVGYAIRSSGKSIEKAFGLLGILLTIVACLGGNFLSAVNLLAVQQGVGYLEMLQLFDYSMTFNLLESAFTPTDLIFYSIAIYQGYAFSFRELTDEEMLEHAGVTEEAKSNRYEL